MTKVTAAVSTRAYYVATRFLKSTSTQNIMYRLVAQQTYSGTVSTRITSSSSFEIEALMYINPSGASMTVTPGSNTQAVVVTYSNGESRFNNQRTFRDIFFMVLTNPLSSSIGTYGVDVQITSSSVPENYPNTEINVEESKLYGNKVHNGCIRPDDGGGLSTGAIVGIVIAVIVVVAIIVFCIVWFVVLKKTCGSSNANDAEVAA